MTTRASQLRTPTAFAAAIGVGLTTLATMSTVAPAPTAHGATARPNVVLITTDDASIVDLRYMPNVQRLLVAQGTTMTDAIAPTPICVPARASILTGQYALNHGARTIDGPRGGFTAFRDTNTLPTWLRRAGYDTLFTGKYLNGYGGSASRDRYVPPGWSDWRGALDPTTYRFFNSRFSLNGRAMRSKGYSTYAITNFSKQMLDRQHKRPNKPFFMWTNYVGPHHGGPRAPDDPVKPWIVNTTPAPQDNNTFRRLAIPKSPDLWEANITGNRFAMAPRNAAYKSAMREVFQQRVEALQSVDRGVASIIGKLRRNGDLANTYVIFTSDNGYLTGHHNRDGKLVPYDKSLRIPMIIRGPGVPRNKRLSTTVTNPDLAVTIARIARAQITRTPDGVNFLPRLTKPATIRPIPIRGWDVHDGRRELYRGIRYGKLTFFRYGKNRRPELYDRARDPGELTNVVNRTRYASQRAMMVRLYNKYVSCRGASCPKAWG